MHNLDWTHVFFPKSIDFCNILELAKPWKEIRNGNNTWFDVTLRKSRATTSCGRGIERNRSANRGGQAQDDWPSSENKSNFPCHISLTLNKESLAKWDWITKCIERQKNPSRTSKKRKATAFRVSDENNKIVRINCLDNVKLGIRRLTTCWTSCFFQADCLSCEARSLVDLQSAVRSSSSWSDCGYYSATFICIGNFGQLNWVLEVDWIN